MKKKYDFVKNDHDSLGSLHNNDFERKKQKKNYILLHEDLGNFERKKIIYILSSTENLFSLL